MYIERKKELLVQSDQVPVLEFADSNFVKFSVTDHEGEPVVLEFQRTEFNQMAGQVLRAD